MFDEVISQRVFLLELNVCKCGPTCFLICIIFKGFHCFFSAAWKFYLSRIIRYLLLNQHSKQSLLSTYEKNWSAFTVVRKIIMYCNNKKLFMKGKNKTLVLQWQSKVQEIVSVSIIMCTIYYISSVWSIVHLILSACM